MNFTLQSCKVEGSAMVLVVTDDETGAAVTTQIAERVCGRSFLAADGAVRSLVEDLLAGINIVLATPKPVEVLPPPPKLPSMRPSKAPPKDAA